MKEIGINPKTNSEYNVMIVDSSSIERKILMRFLNLNSFHVIDEIENPNLILENTKYYDSNPDILFLDSAALAGEGSKILNSLNVKYPFLKTIYIISNKNQEVYLKKNHINEFIKKPYLKKELEDKLIEILSSNSIEMDKGNQKILLKDIFIPPLPTAVSKILTYESNSTGGSQDLEKILYPDKSLCTDLLRVANSSLYGRNGSIKTLHDAITLLGLKTIKNIAFVQARRHLSGNLVKFPNFKKYLYEIPTLSSLICHDLLSFLGLAKEYKEIFLMSSFCKIGMNILALNLKDQYSKILEEYNKGEKPLVDIENEVAALNHIDVSTYVLKEWKMPEVFISISENQGFGLNMYDNVSEIDHIVRTGEILGRNLHNIPISDEEKEILQKVQAQFKLDIDFLEVFSGEYLDNILSHPFFSFF